MGIAPLAARTAIASLIPICLSFFALPLQMAAAPTFDLLVKGDFPRAFIVPNVPVGANTARVAMLVASSRSGSAVGFTAAINDIFLLDAAGKQHCLEPEAVFPAAPGSADPPAAGSTLNIWIETPAPGEPWGCLQLCYSG